MARHFLAKLKETTGSSQFLTVKGVVLTVLSRFKGSGLLFLRISNPVSIERPYSTQAPVTTGMSEIMILTGANSVSDSALGHRKFPG